MTIDRAFLRRLRWLGITEGVSTLVLFFIAMPLKYLADFPAAVTIAGSLHGFLFMCLSAMFVWATQKIPISMKLAVAGVVAAVIPFGPFVIDRWLVDIDRQAECEQPI